MLLLLLGLAVVSPPALAEPVWFDGTGHYYEYVDGQTTWEVALAAAEALEHSGFSGHLVTITSSAENDFVSATFASGEAEFFAWIGGHEPDDNGVWLWGSGPESETQFSQGGSPTPPFYYVNWGGVEPNDFNPGEDFAAINLGDEFHDVFPGQWIDSPNPNPSDPIHGMVVEYEDATGLPPDMIDPSSVFLSRPTAFPSPGAGDAVTVRFELARPCLVSASVYDAGGRVATRSMEAGIQDSGEVCLQLDCAGLPAGVYFVQVSARPPASAGQRQMETTKIVILE